MTIRVLLVDDNELLVRSIFRAFLNQGYDVRRAVSYDEAVVVAAQLNPDVIVADFHLKSYSHTGADLLHVCKCNRPETVTILISGEIDDRYLGEIENDQDIDRYFSKPVAISELVATINELTVTI